MKWREEVDNYQDGPGPARPQIFRRRAVGETDGVSDQGRHGQHGQLLLPLQLTGGGVLGVPGQHAVDLTDLARVETPLRQELLQPLSHLQSEHE